MGFKKPLLTSILIPGLVLLAYHAGRAAFRLSNFTDSGQSLGGSVESSDVALGDLDGDTDLDAVVASFGGSSRVYLNQGGDQGGTPGIFQDSGQALSADSAVDVALEDLDGDTDPDIFLLRDSFGESNEVWLNQGIATGVFTRTAQTFGDSQGTSVALGDLDGANGPDAFIGRGFGQPSKVWLNNGGGGFIDSGQSLDSDSNDLALGDLDGDLDLDAFSANGSNNKVWINQGGAQMGAPGSFLESGQVLTSTLSLSVALGDLDGDDDLDAWIGNNFSDRIWVNQGGAQAGTPGVFLVGASTSSGQTRDVELGDLDGDGDLDAFLAKSDGNQVWINQGGDQGGTEGDFVASPQSLGNSFSEGLDLGDVDGDTDLDAFVANWPDPDKVWLNQSASPGPGGEAWQVSHVATRGDAGLYGDLALDAAGLPHITYVRFIPVVQDGDNYRLVYAYWDGVRWHSERVDLDQHMGGTGGYNALALDSNGYPHIAYTAGTGSLFLNLKYAFWDGTAWQVQTIDDSEDIEPQVALALDSGDHPHILYQDNDTNELLYTSWDGAAWTEQTIASNMSQETAHALVLDANDLPHISYNDTVADVIRYAHFDGLNWQNEAVNNPLSLTSAYTDIALDSAGNPAIAYSWGSFESEIHYASWDGQDWVIETAAQFPSLSVRDRVNLAFDGGGDPHILTSPSDLSASFLAHFYKDSGSWISETLDNNGYVGPYSNFALDAQDRLHAVYYDQDYEDLRYGTWGPDWEIRGLGAGTVQSPAVRINNGIPSIGYYDLAGGLVSLARWDQAWEFFPASFVSAPARHVDHATGFSSEHLSWYDADSNRLMYARQSPAGWTPVVVDETVDAGMYNDLELVGTADGLPRIAYWDATFNRVKAAVLSGTNPAPALHTNTTGPVLNAGSGYTHLAILPDTLLGISYYDGVGGDLRFAILNPDTGVWTDELVDGILGADVGRLNDVQTDGTDGYPVVAYYDETNDAIKLAYDDGAWQIQTAVPNAGGVQDLALELGLGSRTRVRIAYTTGSGELKAAVLDGGVWEVETVLDGAAGLDEVSMALDDRPHLAYNDGGLLYYAFRAGSLDVDITLPGEPPPFTSGGYYNPLDACQAVLDLFTGFDKPTSTGLLLRLAQSENLSDLAVFAAMQGIFSGSTGGQFYIDLYDQHGSEMGQIGLDDPALLWDSWGTLQNFLPGLEALVTGQGDQFIVTQDMVGDALDIWQRLAAAGSPALANTINTELAKYNNLQDFVGMSFDEWAQSLGVELPQKTYLPIAARN